MKVVLLSDIHANLVALKAVLEHSKNLYGSDVRTYCLGDVIGYGPSPIECLRLLEDLEIDFVLGNHEAAFLDDDLLIHFKDMAALSSYWTKIQLTNNQGGKWLELIQSKNETIEANIDGVEMIFAHASPQSPIWTYMYPESDLYLLLEAFEHMPNSNIAFIGHTHKPVIFSQLIESVNQDELSHQEDIDDGFIDYENNSSFDDTVLADMETYIPTESPQKLDLNANKYIVNCGSVGLSRDSDKRACYVVFDTTTKEVIHHRVDFDNEVNIKLLNEIPSFGGMLANHFAK